MGVADLDFPKGVEFSNSHQFFYIPSRNISCTQTLVRNLFTDHPKFCLYFPYVRVHITTRIRLK